MIEDGLLFPPTWRKDNSCHMEYPVNVLVYLYIYLVDPVNEMNIYLIDSTSATNLRTFQPPNVLTLGMYQVRIPTLVHSGIRSSTNMLLENVVSKSQSVPWTIGQCCMDFLVIVPWTWYSETKKAVLCLELVESCSSYVEFIIISW